MNHIIKFTIFLIAFSASIRVNSQIEVINLSGIDLESSEVSQVYNNMKSLLPESQQDNFLFKIVINYMHNLVYNDPLDLVGDLSTLSSYYFVVEVKLSEEGGILDYHLNLPDTFGLCGSAMFDNYLMIQKQGFTYWTADEGLKFVDRSIMEYKSQCELDVQQMKSMFVKFLESEWSNEYQLESLSRDTSMNTFPISSSVGMVQVTRFSNLVSYTSQGIESIISTYISILNDPQIFDFTEVNIYIIDDEYLKEFLKEHSISTIKEEEGKLRVILYLDGNKDMLYMKSYGVSNSAQGPALRGSSISSQDDLFDYQGNYLSTGDFRSYSSSMPEECQKNSIYIKVENGLIYRIDEMPPGSTNGLYIQYSMPRIMKHYWCKEYNSELSDTNKSPVFLAEGYAELDSIRLYGYNYEDKIIIPYEFSTWKVQTSNKFRFLSTLVHEYRHFVRQDSYKPTGYSCESKNTLFDEDINHVCEVYFYQLGRKSHAFGNKYLSDLMCTDYLKGSFASTVDYLHRYVDEVTEGYQDGTERNNLYKDITQKVKEKFVLHGLNKIALKYTLKEIDNIDRIRDNFYNLWAYYYLGNNDYITPSGKLTYYRDGSDHRIKPCVE